MKTGVHHLCRYPKCLLSCGDVTGVFYREGCRGFYCSDNITVYVWPPYSLLCIRLVVWVHPVRVMEMTGDIIMQSSNSFCSPVRRTLRFWALWDIDWIWTDNAGRLSIRVQPASRGSSASTLPVCLHLHSMHNRSWVSLVVETTLRSVFLGSAVFFVVPLALVWRLTFGVVGSAMDWVSAVRIPRPVKFFREKQRAAVAAASASTTLALELLPSWSEGAGGKRQGKPRENQQACQPRRQTSSVAPASSTGTLVERAASGRRTHRQSRALAFLHSFMISHGERSVKQS
ncbi:uncharacterized protein LOC119598436 [Penaeus monodon]|uniref:uncharacterized protein LOC119598436 n=1 Tax=Penaeus monodon TaxID=6687 RepID=UPI0018A7D4FE|nr:uncharacterized protein LOC119598436 [Penaeus monodon]